MSSSSSSSSSSTLAAGRSSLGGGSGNWSSSGELAGISQELLELFSLLEGDLGNGSHGKEILHSVGNAVWSAGHCWVSNLQADTGNVPDSTHEHVLDIIIGDVEDL